MAGDVVIAGDVLIDVDATTAGEVVIDGGAASGATGGGVTMPEDVPIAATPRSRAIGWAVAAPLSNGRGSVAVKPGIVEVVVDGGLKATDGGDVVAGDNVVGVPTFVRPEVAPAAEA
jgi:hypothetical protein